MYQTLIYSDARAANGQTEYEFTAATDSIRLRLKRKDHSGQGALSFFVERSVLRIVRDTMYQDTVTIATAAGYRYGFNGMMKDNEWNGLGNSYDFGLRIYDARLARFFSTDPRTPEYPWQSPYVYHRNSPIVFIDYLGGGDPPKTEDYEVQGGDNLTKLAENLSKKVGHEVTVQDLMNLNSDKDWGSKRRKFDQNWIFIGEKLKVPTVVTEPEKPLFIEGDDIKKINIDQKYAQQAVEGMKTMKGLKPGTHIQGKDLFNYTWLDNNSGGNLRPFYSSSLGDGTPSNYVSNSVLTGEDTDNPRLWIPGPTVQLNPGITLTSAGNLRWRFIDDGNSKKVQYYPKDGENQYYGWIRICATGYIPNVPNNGSRNAFVITYYYENEKQLELFFKAHGELGYPDITYFQPYKKQ